MVSALNSYLIFKQGVLWGNDNSHWQHPSSLQVVASPSCFTLQLWWEEEPCISTMLPSHRLSAWKLREEEVAPSRAEGSMGTLPSSSASPQPEKLPPPVLGSGAPASDKTVAAAPLSHACEVEMSQCLDAKAHSGLACVNNFGPGLGKAHATTLGNPFKPIAAAPSSDLGQGSPKCSPCLRKGTPTPTPASAGTHQREASPPITEHPPPPVEAHNPQGKLSSPPISSRGESSSSSTPFWDTGFEKERGSYSGPVESTPREAEASPNPLSMMFRDGSTVVLTEAPSPHQEKDVAKQRDLSFVPLCEEGWSEEELSKLFHFSKVLGMPVEGHEVEILALLKKLKLRIGSSTLCKRQKKKKSCTTCFERELKRLECSVSYGGTSGITKNPVRAPGI